jgi:putative membrane protein
MIHDHTLALDQLKAVASSEGLSIPAGVSPKDQKSFDELKGQNGVALDKRYTDAQVKDHRQVIAQFKGAARQSDLLPAVREYARKSVPTLQTHLHLAQQLVATEAKGNRSAG